MLTFLSDKKQLYCLWALSTEMEAKNRKFYSLPDSEQTAELGQLKKSSILEFKKIIENRL